MICGDNMYMHQKLKKLYDEDQLDRKNWKEWGKTIPLEEVQKRDQLRLETVLTLIGNNELKEGIDYYHAAMILQHSDKVEHYKLANELCDKAMKLGEERAKWLYAATLDRYLLNSGSKYQKFGTQYQKNKHGLWELCPIDPATTDEIRAHYNVPSLNKLKEREKSLNS